MNAPLVSISTCPVCDTAPKVIANGGTTTIFCERCYDTGHETTVCVRFDHNVAGLNRLVIAANLWERTISEYFKMSEAPQ